MAETGEQEVIDIEDPGIDRVTLARMAENLLNDEVLKLAYSRAYARMVTGIVQTDPEEGEKREALYHKVRALGEITRELRMMRDDGVAAEAEAKQAERNRNAR